MPQAGLIIPKINVKPELNNNNPNNVMKLPKVNAIDFKTVFYTSTRIVLCLSDSALQYSNCVCKKFLAEWEMPFIGSLYPENWSLSFSGMLLIIGWSEPH